MSVVDLRRTFLELLGQNEDIDPDAPLELTHSLTKPLTWDDLLLLPHVVILGERGTGKTTEFRRQVRLSPQVGRPAWLASVEVVADMGLESSLSPAESEELRRWRPAGGEAHFFLDSLDEAKLNGKKLGQALRRLRNELGAAFPRAKLILSCRFSDWRPRSDLEELKDILGPTDARARGTNERPTSPPVRGAGYQTVSHVGDGRRPVSTDADRPRVLLSRARNARRRLAVIRREPTAGAQVHVPR